MASILLNGVVTDTNSNSISGSDLPDKLTVNGGVDGLNVDLAAGDDSLVIYADSEDVTDTQIRVSEGDDEIWVYAADGPKVDDERESTTFAGLPISFGDSLLGGPGDDQIILDDGLVQLTGALKGNEGDDYLDVSYINGGTVNGNAGDDEIALGDTDALENRPGERGEAVLTSASVMGGKGDDAIFVENAVITDSAIRGNEGDDVIYLDGNQLIGTITVNGNAGDDYIVTPSNEGALTVLGGQGDDTIWAGSGQTVRGNLGADTFIVGTGGVTIEDFDNLKDGEDCFCGDKITVYTSNRFQSAVYEVNQDLYTSKSSWLGNLKVKAVVDNDNCEVTATAKLTATKTATLNATAVAYLKVTDTRSAVPLAQGSIGSINYPAVGRTQNGATFNNGNAGFVFNTTDKEQRAGLGKAFASNTGYWTQQPIAGQKTAQFGAVFPYASTYAKFAKGDFSFLQLTATAKAGCTKSQKLVFDDATRATITNHWASFKKDKTTVSARLFTLGFGTNNFSTVLTGKAHMS